MYSFNKAGSHNLSDYHLYFSATDGSWNIGPEVQGSVVIAFVSSKVTDPRDIQDVWSLSDGTSFHSAPTFTVASA